MPLFKKTTTGATNTYRCPQCGFTKTKSAGGIFGAISMSVAPKCPKCGVKMELVSSSR